LNITFTIQRTYNKGKDKEIRRKIYSRLMMLNVTSRPDITDLNNKIKKKNKTSFIITIFPKRGKIKIL